MSSRNNQFISVIVITYNRTNELKKCLSSIFSQNYSKFEVIIVDNNENPNISSAVKKIISSFPQNKIKYFKISKNLGVPGGRNFGVLKSKGEILIFIDDDAYFETKETFEKVIKKFQKDKEIGILSFKIVNYYSRKIDPKEFPHRNKRLNPDKEFETTYFIGAGHAIRKEVFSKAGLYPEDFFYGDEELDLSFRAIDKGFKIVYFPEVVVWHKPSKKGRINFQKMWEKVLENRIKVSLRNLPLRYVISRAIFWSFFVFFKTKNPFLVFKVYKKIFLNLKKILSQRKVISKTAILKIKKLKGRLFF